MNKQQLRERDWSIYGVSIELDGKRIDPKDYYKEPDMNREQLREEVIRKICQVRYDSVAGTPVAMMREIEKEADTLTELFFNKAKEMVDIKESRNLQRLIVLATKWVPKEHHDWKELNNMGWEKE